MYFLQCGLRLKFPCVVAFAYTEFTNRWGLCIQACYSVSGVVTSWLLKHPFRRGHSTSGHEPEIPSRENSLSRQRGRHVLVHYQPLGAAILEKHGRADRAA